MAGLTPKRRIAFSRLADAALRQADILMQRWLPEGRREGHEWVARNTTRSDSRLGSFKVKLSLGKWSDFAAGDRGGDLIRLGAYLFQPNPGEAARRNASMLGIGPPE